MDGELTTFAKMKARQEAWFPGGQIEIMIAKSIFRATCEEIQWNHHHTPSKIIFIDTWMWKSNNDMWVRRGSAGAVLFPIRYREQFQGPFEISPAGEVFFMIQNYNGPFQIQADLLEIDSIESSPQYITLFPRGHIPPHKPQNTHHSNLYEKYFARS